jgi:hypothetical protein
MLLEKEEGFVRSDITFCHGQAKPYLLAAAVSARVDIYKLT